MKKAIYFIVLIIVSFFVQSAKAQVGVSIRILPPYPNRITDYESRPQQVLITITNQSAGVQQVQLRAAVVGDNGIRLEVGRNYKSPTPITLAPGQVRSLNGADLVTLFDYNQLTYTGITKDEFIRGNGLPEGSYQVCMQAYDYNTNALISGDEPVGCSNRFTISSLEPPLIIKPFDGDELKARTGNIFTINWTTPPGAPPSIRYRIRIIETLPNRNPNDAYLSAIPPYFFEKEVMGNVYVYNPADPQLTVGRRYVLTVTAFDPNNSYSFRNNGISEVRSFTYSEQLVSKQETKKPDTTQKPKKPMTTNSIKGKALWAFKASEEIFKGNNGSAFQALTGGYIENGDLVVVQMPKTFPNGGLNELIYSSKDASGKGSGVKGDNKGLIGGIVYNAFNPLTDNPENVRNAVSTDKTILTYGNNKYLNSVVDNNASAPTSITSSIFVTGNQALESSIDGSSGLASSIKMPLAKATVKIIGIPSSNPINLNPHNRAVQKEQDKKNEEATTKFGIFSTNIEQDISGKKDNVEQSGKSKNSPGPIKDKVKELNLNMLNVNLIASGKTDDDGNFDINFADLNFSGGDQYSKVKIVITKGALEQTKIIPISMLKNPDVDLGEIICLAPTYRFTPTVQLPQIEGNEDDKNNIVVKIYRDDIYDAIYPYLNYDGNLAPDKKIKQLVGGKNLVLIGVDSIKNAVKASFKFGRLFSGINYTVQISTGGNVNKLIGSLKLSKLELPETQIANVKPTYTLTAMPPSIVGSVQLSLKNGFASVKNAIVKVEFNKDDVMEMPKNTSNLGKIGGSQYDKKVVTGLLNANAQFETKKPASSASINEPSTAKSFYNTSNNGALSGGGSKGLINGALNSSLTNIEESNYLSAPYTTKTDSTGNYAIGNLPILKEGKMFTVKLIKVPLEFKDLQIDPANEMVISRILDGQQKDVSFRIKPELVQVVGRVVAENKKALANARLYFQGSSDVFTSGESGLFTTTYFPGKHTLIIKKEGYVDASIQIVVPSKESKNNNDDSKRKRVDLPQDILQTNHLFKVKDINGGDKIDGLNNKQANAIDLSIQLLNSPTIKKEIGNGSDFSPLLFGVAGSQSVNNFNNSGIKKFGSNGTPTVTNISTGGGSLVAFKANSFNGTADFNNETLGGLAQLFDNSLTNSNYSSNSLNTRDLGDIGYLKRKLGKIRFKIIDAETNAVIAAAKIKLFDTVGVTNDKGEWYYEGFGGDAKVTVTPETGSAYVMVEESLLINENGNELPRTIKLEKGIKVSGFVRNNNIPINSATIEVQEKSYLTTTADVSGAYSFYVPKGDFQLKAKKSGYLSDSKLLNTKNGAVQQDFELGDGGGKNIAKILGFDVELDQMKQEGAAYRISGAFVNLVPALSDLKASNNIKLQFSNIKVNFDASNNAIPEGDKIVTDELSLALKLMNYIPVTLKSQNGITIEADGNGGGKVLGEISANLVAIQGSRGWSLTSADVKLIPDNINTTTFLKIFSSSGTVESVAKFKFKGPQTGWEGNLYGFKFIAQTEQSYVAKDGLHFVGSVQTPDLGPIKSSTFKIEEFLIGSDLLVKRVKIAQDNLPTIKILDWSAKVASLLFNEDGFKIGGAMTIKVPASGTSTINFSDVSISKDMFFGGKFIIPASGINIFNIVSLKKGASPISFGQVPNQSGVYKLGGSGKIKFTKLISSEINIPIFEVHTNGRLLVDAPANFETNLAFAKIKVQAIKFDNTSGVPFIGVKGEISVDVPLLSLSAADITFKNNGSGVSVNVGKIKASLDVPVLKTDLEVEMKDNGFAGAGKLGVPGTPINAGIDFHYFKVNGGIDFGANFSANVSIPIGFVTIERVGGGFSYNTASKDFMIDINGALSIANLGAAVKLDPIGLTVRSGPVIEGYGSVVVGTALTLASAKMKLDFPQETFSVTVDSDIEPIKGVASAKLQGDLIISLKNEDRYVFLGCGMETNLLGLIKANGEFALGVGIKDPTTRGDRISYYFRNVDKRYVRDVFSGVYINTTAKMGIPENKAIGFDLAIASAKLWYYTEANAKLVLNFAEDSYLFGLSGRFGGGFDVCVASIACAGFGYDACYEFMGGRNDMDGWFFSGKAAGKVQLKIGGCDPSCNSISIHPFCAGFKVCANGGASISYKQHGGLSLGVFAGGTPMCP